MEIIIVGLHSSGKFEIQKILKKYGIKCASLFSDIDKNKTDIYGVNQYITYTPEDIKSINSNNAAIFINSIPMAGNMYFEGLSCYDFENNDVCVLSPHQLVQIPSHKLKNKLIVWVDNTRGNRFTRHSNENRTYNFIRQEGIDGECIKNFTEYIYSSPYIYFNNENEERIATIIYTIIKYPELKNIYITNFK